MQDEKPGDEAAQARMPSTVVRLGWVSFFADVASEMVYPVIPLFLKSVLRTGAGTLGAIEGVAEAIVSIMKGWSGFHSDRTGKRVPLVRFGYGLSAVGKPLLAIAGNWTGVLAARSLDRIGKGIRTTPRDALIVDSISGKVSSGAAFGFHRAMDTAGALVGVLICYALLQWTTVAFRTIFLLAAIPAAASVLFTLSIKDQKQNESQSSKTTVKPSLKNLDKRYWIALFVSLLFGIANSSDTFLLLRAKEVGLSDANVILAYAMYNITFMLLSYPFGKLSDRWGRWPVLAMGWMIYAISYWGFSIITHLQVLAIWPLFGLYGTYMGMTKGVTSAMVADYAPKERRGSALGFFYMMSGLATLFASLLTGILWDQYSAKIAFQIDAILAVIASAMILLLHKSMRSPSLAQ